MVDISANISSQFPPRVKRYGLYELEIRSRSHQTSPDRASYLAVWISSRRNLSNAIRSLLRLWCRCQRHDAEFHIALSLVHVQPDAFVERTLTQTVFIFVERTTILLVKRLVLEIANDKPDLQLDRSMILPFRRDGHHRLSRR